MHQPVYCIHRDSLWPSYFRWRIAFLLRLFEKWPLQEIVKEKFNTAKVNKDISNSQEWFLQTVNELEKLTRIKNRDITTIWRKLCHTKYSEILRNGYSFFLDEVFFVWEQWWKEKFDCQIFWCLISTKIDW